MTGLELAAVAVGMSIAAFVSGGAGFGFALIGAPMLALVDAELIPVTVIVASTALNLMVAVRDRQGLDLHSVRWALVGALPGSVAGAAVVAAVPASTLAAVLGIVILVLSAASVAAPHFEPSRRLLVSAGVVSGVAGTATSVGGPPIALALQHRSGAELRGTLAVYFMATSVLALGLLAAFGELGARQAGIGVVLVPPVVVGFGLSGHAARFLDRGHSRRAVLAFSVTSAVVLLVRHLG